MSEHAGQPGRITVVLFGEADLDVTQVEPSSLRFAGGAPVQLSIADANQDGYPDLVLTFDTMTLQLQAKDERAWLSGWLKNSQELVGSDLITIVTEMAKTTPSCR